MKRVAKLCMVLLGLTIFVDSRAVAQTVPPCAPMQMAQLSAGFQCSLSGLTLTLQGVAYQFLLENPDGSQTYLTPPPNTITVVPLSNGLSLTNIPSPLSPPASYCVGIGGLTQIYIALYFQISSSGAEVSSITASLNGLGGPGNSPSAIIDAGISIGSFGVSAISYVPQPGGSFAYLTNTKPISPPLSAGTLSLFFDSSINPCDPTFSGPFTISSADYTFTEALARKVVIDPGHGQILVNGALTYQRPPSPTYGLIEDVLTLDMANTLRSQLQAANVTVLLTRETSLAPFAPPNCAVPCFADLNKRVRWIEKQEPDLMVSVHTNAALLPTANGSESYYSTVPPSPDSSSLAQSVLTRIVGLGLNNRGLKQMNFNILNTSMPSALAEVAFHTNSQLAAGQAITDEAFLNDPSARGAAAIAIANGVLDYYASH